jgi:hypothetical protein
MDFFYSKNKNRTLLIRLSSLTVVVSARYHVLPLLMADAIYHI